MVTLGTRPSRWRSLCSLWLGTGVTAAQASRSQVGRPRELEHSDRPPVARSSLGGHLQVGYAVDKKEYRRSQRGLE
jgi:hypothetical protein